MYKNTKKYLVRKYGAKMLPVYISLGINPTTQFFVRRGNNN